MICGVAEGSNSNSAVFAVFAVRGMLETEGAKGLLYSFGTEMMEQGCLNQVNYQS